MAWTIDSALEDELVTVVSREDAKETYHILIGELKTIVTIKLSSKGNTSGTFFSTSHAIKTPDQITPYNTSRPWGDTPAYALHQAISGLTDYYGTAFKNRHSPSEDWLHPK